MWLARVVGEGDQVGMLPGICCCLWCIPVELGWKMASIHQQGPLSPLAPPPLFTGASSHLCTTKTVGFFSRSSLCPLGHWGLSWHTSELRKCVSGTGFMSTGLAWESE